MSMDDPAVEPARSARAIARLARTAGILQASPDFLDKLPIAIYACDIHGHLLWFNDRAVQLWGRKPRIGDDSDEFCSSCKLFFATPPVTREQSPMAYVLRTGLPVRGAEGLIERPDGSSMRTRAYIEPVEDEDGTLVGAINCFHETIEPDRRDGERHAKRVPQQLTSVNGAPRRANDTEYLLRQHEQRLEAIYEHAGIGIAEVDADGALLRVNSKLCTLMGYAAEELLGRSIFDETYADDADRDRQQFRLQTAGEIDCYNIEKRIRRKDGGYFWASINSTSVRDSDGRFLYGVRIQHDISERKRAEQVDRQLSMVVESSNDAIITNDLHGTITTWNRGAERLLGYATEEVIGKPVSMLIPKDRQEEDLRTLERIRRGERIEHYETVRRRKDGTLVDISLAVSPLKDAEGKVIGASKVARDIADRKRLEQVDRRLSLIVESSNDAIVTKDLDGIITTWNRGAERLFGYAAEEVVGKPITIVIPEDRQHEETRILERIRRGQPVDHYETVRQRKDGTLVDISLAVSPLKNADGKVVGASKVARDISDRKRAEAKLRESESRLQALLSAMPAAIYTTDARGKITYFNQTAVELAGRTPKIGSDEWCVTWKLYKPDGTPLPHDQCPMAIALKEGRPIRNAEAVAERPDGTRFPFIPYPTPLRDENGAVIGAINMLVDVSERKQAETQQRVLLDELNHRVKNNMQILQSVLHSAARETKSAEARAVLRDAGQRIAAMAAAQRVLYGTADASRFGAEEFLNAVCKTIRQTLGDHVEIFCERASGQLSNDVAMPLALILNELLTNAVKHGLNCGEGIIRVGLTEEAESFLLYVEDDGPGFDLQSVRKRSSGLGLVQGLARQLRGTLEVMKRPATRCMVRFLK